MHPTLCRYTIDNIEWILAAVDRADTTHPYSGCATWATIRSYCHTRYAPLKRLHGIIFRGFHHFGHIDDAHSAGQILLALSLIAGDNYLIESFFGTDQPDIQKFLVPQ
ncbi:hypothetical protein D3C81_1285290 [compost metagenome]